MSCQWVATQDFNTTIHYLFDVRLIRLIVLREYQTKQMSDLVKPGREKKQFVEGEAYLFLQVSLVMNMRDDQLSPWKKRGNRQGESFQLSGTLTQWRHIAPTKLTVEAKNTWKQIAPLPSHPEPTQPITILDVFLPIISIRTNTSFCNL